MRSPSCASPTASSICGRRSRIVSEATSRRSAGSRSEIFLRQDMALGHVGDETRLALVEADQDRALFHDVPHGEARAVAIAPCRSLDRRQHPLRAHASDARQRLFQRALLRGDLERRMRVLQRAAATYAEMRAAGRDARGVRLDDGVTRAVSNDGLTRTLAAWTRSPGSAPSTKTALPSTRATPRPSWSSDSMARSVEEVRAEVAAMRCSGTMAREFGERPRIVPLRRRCEAQAPVKFVR